MAYYTIKPTTYQLNYINHSIYSSGIDAHTWQEKGGQ